MQTTFALSQSIVPSDSPTTLDVLISFQAATAATPRERRPLNLSLVIDRSASMAGLPLKHAIQAAQALIEQMTPRDTLSIVTYDDNVETILPPQLVTDRAAIQAVVGKVRPGGCTNLSGGWLKGCDHALSGSDPESIRRVLLLTDGQANAGVRDPAVLIKTAQQKADAGVVTTTLGFGAHFNEDLLIGMAKAAGGNFYFIQSPNDAVDVFKMEMDSLKSVAAQNLTVTLQPAPGVQIQNLLSSYRAETNGTTRIVSLGDVYENEDKLLALELAVPAQSALGAHDLLHLLSVCDVISNDGIVQDKGDLAATYQVGTIKEAMAAVPGTEVIAQITRIRIARAKDEAIEMADRGDHAGAAQKLRAVIADLRRQGLHESFESGRRIGAVGVLCPAHGSAAV